MPRARRRRASDPRFRRSGCEALDPCAVHFEGLPRCRPRPARRRRRPRRRPAGRARWRSRGSGSPRRAVGLAQAAFEAALRYAQQRTRPSESRSRSIGRSSVALADMATAVTASRLLTADTAGEAARPHPRRDGQGVRVGDGVLRSRSIRCASTAGTATRASSRSRRYYRDAARLASSPLPNTVERRELARALAATRRAAVSRETRGVMVERVSPESGRRGDQSGGRRPTVDDGHLHNCGSVTRSSRS